MLAAGLHDVPPGHLAAVVTYLEATAAPAARRPLREDVDFEAWHPDLAAYRGLFRRIGTPWLWSSRLSQPDDEVLGALGDPAYETFVLRDASGPLGMLDLDLRDPGTAWIAFFGLVPEATGQGLGSALMAEALGRALARARRVRLHTCTLDDPRALGFYRAQGFVPYARAVEILPDPRGTHLPENAAPAQPRL